MIEQNRHQDEITVRRQLERFFKDEFWETTWSDFTAGDYVSDYLDGRPDMDLQELRSNAEEALKRQHRYEREALQRHGMLEESEDADSRGAADRPRRPSFRSGFAIKLAERTRMRADALLKISMRQAAEHPDVKRFRNERLGGQLLYYDETEAYISPGMGQEITDWELADLVRRLEHEYGWRRDDAASFVLTGSAPRLRPLTVGASVHQISKYGPSYCKITLHVAPWVPPEEVKRAFTQMRDQVRRGSGPGTVSKQRLEVLRFVEEETQRAQHGRRPSFEVLLKTWNHKYPHWAYAKYNALSKAHREAYQEVVYPKYH